jgi:hypothetical protein
MKENETDHHSLQLDTSPKEKENETDHHPLQLDTTSHHISQPNLSEIKQPLPLIGYQIPSHLETDHHSLQLNTTSPVDIATQQTIQHATIHPGPDSIEILPVHKSSFRKNYDVEDVKMAIAKARSPLVVEGETLCLNGNSLIKYTILCSIAKLSFVPGPDFDNTNQDHNIERTHIMNLLDFVDFGSNASYHGGDLELRESSLWRSAKEKKRVI